MRFSPQILALLIAFACASCAKKSPEYALLKDSLLQIYANDSLKQRASLIILADAKLKKSYYGEAYQTYRSTVESYKDNRDQQANMLKSLRNTFAHLKVTSDTLILSAAFLKKNIDESFATWKRVPWREHVSFYNFCQYILPYKVDAEEPEYWRAQAVARIPDSLKNMTDLKRACYAIATLLSESKKDFKILYGNNALGIPPLPYSSLKGLRSGACDDITRYAIYCLRANGFPVAKDFTPNWANRSSGHTWCALVTDSINSVPFNFPIERWYPYLGNYKWSDRLESKVYRYNASVNPKSHAMLRGKHVNYLPDFINDPRIVDVTEKYVDTDTVALPLDPSYTGKESFAYIAVYEDFSWPIVGWGKIQDGIATFEKIVKNALYLPVALKDSTRTIPINYPFVVTNEGLRIFKPDYGSLQLLTLKRKYPLFSDIQRYTRHMINGKFQGANSPDFSDTVDLYTIKSDPGVYYNEVRLSNSKKFKYYRYKGAAYSWSNVAEVEFYGKGDAAPMKGEIIGAIGSNNDHPERTVRAVFDGNPLSFYEAKDWNTGWAGMHFDTPVTIEKIRFMARTDYNIVVEGNTYELFLWDNEWQSLGKQIAMSTVLFYKNVPSNSILLLRNLSSGKEERIFSFEHNEQVWW